MLFFFFEWERSARLFHTFGNLPCYWLAFLHLDSSFQGIGPLYYRLPTVKHSTYFFNGILHSEPPCLLPFLLPSLPPRPSLPFFLVCKSNQVEKFSHLTTLIYFLQQLNWISYFSLFCVIFDKIVVCSHFLAFVKNWLHTRVFARYAALALCPPRASSVNRSCLAHKFSEKLFKFRCKMECFLFFLI